MGNENKAKHSKQKGKEMRNEAEGGDSPITVKKVSGFPVPSRDVTNQTLLGR